MHCANTRLQGRRQGLPLLTYKTSSNASTASLSHEKCSAQYLVPYFAVRGALCLVKCTPKNKEQARAARETLAMPLCQKALALGILPYLYDILISLTFTFHFSSGVKFCGLHGLGFWCSIHMPHFHLPFWCVPKKLSLLD